MVLDGASARTSARPTGARPRPTPDAHNCDASQSAAPRSGEVVVVVMVFGGGAGGKERWEGVTYGGDCFHAIPAPLALRQQQPRDKRES